MSLTTIVLFFIYTWGLGYSATKFIKNSENFLERNLMRIGIGLGIFPFLGVLINLIRIPLDWRIFLVLSLIMPLLDLFKSDIVKQKKLPIIKLKLTKSNISILVVLLLFSLSLFMYASGAFRYTWLEDDDPWHHATAIKYVATEKDVFHIKHMYINPYPPGYDLLFGILHQTSLSLYWTMKFFNALIISLGIIFFYFFTKRFIGNGKKALFAAFVLASIPCYLSHFIWAHSLVVTLFFPAMYCIEMLKWDKRWVYPSILVIAGICLIQPTQPIKFAFLFGMYFLVKWISSKKFNPTLLTSLFGGYFVSLIWWFNHWKDMFISRVSETGGAGIGSSVSFFAKTWGTLKRAFPPTSGSATRAYSFNEMIFAKHQNMINNPIGIGLFISLLAIIGLIFVIINYKKLLKDENNYLSITLLWAIFTFLGFNTMTFNLPIGLFSFRFWMLFAIPASILAAEGLWLLYSTGKKYSVPKIVILIIVVSGIIFTSTHQKYSVNTATWPPGLGWGSYEEVQGYVWLRDNLPINTGVFTFTENYFVVGFDMFSCEWCSDIKSYRKTAINNTASELNSWLKGKKYSHLVIDGRTIRKFGINETNTKLGELVSSQLFNPIHQAAGIVVLEVR
ncbi:hypothetical protein KY360_07110 [Candidatus Woesearchaeota archaeon]|nr:hypothetical protein [Candidatus Woesearchaeota archaeon]